MHSAHGDIHEIGLQDDCEDCAAHAEKPWNNLDRDMLEKLIKRNYFYRWGEYEDINRDDYSPRSTNEAIAMAQITNQMERMGSLMQADPDNLIQSYLEKKWGVEF